MAQKPDTRNFLERRFNLPPLGELKDNVDSVNTLLQALDKEKLRMLQHLLDSLIKLQQAGKPQEIDQLSSIFQLVCAMPVEKIQAVCTTIVGLNDFVCSLQKLIKMLPPDMVANIKLGDLIGQVKEGMG